MHSTIVFVKVRSMVCHIRLLNAVEAHKLVRSERVKSTWIASCQSAEPYAGMPDTILPGKVGMHTESYDIMPYQTTVMITIFPYLQWPKRCSSASS